MHMFWGRRWDEKMADTQKWEKDASFMFTLVEMLGLN